MSSKREELSEKTQQVLVGFSLYRRSGDSDLEMRSLNSFDTIGGRARDDFDAQLHIPLRINDEKGCLAGHDYLPGSYLKQRRYEAHLMQKGQDRRDDPGHAD